MLKKLKFYVLTKLFVKIRLKLKFLKQTCDTKDILRTASN